METGFSQPVLGCCVVVELAAVGIGRFLRVKVFKSAVIPKIYFVVMIDRDGARADCLVSEASFMEIR